MMATAGPACGSSLLPLLESLEDSKAGQPELTDVYLTIASRLGGEEGRQFLPAVEKHFARLGKAILTHITGPNTELSQAALQALGFCVYHTNVVSGVPERFAAEILSALCSLVVTTTDKNSCTRALWVISKQSFPAEVVAKKVDLVLDMLGRVLTRQDIKSVVMEHEALNVVIRMLEQAPVQMGVGAVRWSKVVIPMVVHSASKVRLRAAAAMELGMPLLMERQNEVAAILEPLMSTKLVPELQKLFASKNEVNVLKLWPLFVKLLGKHLHRGGPFINSLLHLEELGFRSPSPNVKKIAFIAWKSLIDNFALNPEILCSSKRMKLLLQPLLSIHVRTEALQLSRLEVWWYLVVRLGPNLGPHFEQVSIPLLQITIGADSSSMASSSSSSLQAVTPAKGAGQNSTLGLSTPKTGTPTCLNSSANTPRMNLNNSSMQASQNFPQIQQLGLEMLLHYFLGPGVVPMAARVNLRLTLEPLTFLPGGSIFTRHASVLIANVKDGFIAIGADAPETLLATIWRSLVSLVSSTVDSGCSSKKDRQSAEVLTLTLQALQAIVSSEALPVSRVLVLFEITVKGIQTKVLGSAAYQVGKMDVLNGTPALFLILLLYNSNQLSAFAEDERFFQCLTTLVGCGLGGPTSSLAFAEAVLGAVGRMASSVANKEHLWRMWSAVVTPLTDGITQSNEVNQGDALEHNFGAVHSALMFPITHLLLGAPLNQMTQKSLLVTWSKLYRVFARCSALVPTADENSCCQELCVKMAAVVNAEALSGPAALDAVSSILQVMVECVDFSPYTPHFQQKTKSPHTPISWTRKRSQALGNLAAFHTLLLQALEAFLAAEDHSESTGLALVSVLSTVFHSLSLATPLQAALGSLAPPLGTICRRASTSKSPAFSSQMVSKLQKLLMELLCILQSPSMLTYDDQFLAHLSPLLCEAFLHRKLLVRKQATHFWSATFAKASSLTYPEELKPILTQVKQKTPIILPGFEAVTVTDEHSGMYSSDSSQLETKLSGVQVSSAGKRDSLLGRAADSKDRSNKLVSTKLDFGSPKPPLRGVLEEEASIDFVFIPPETKERVLTEHQKEVKRTKRTDLPAMYNNLDASLDTTAFTQYTQSQDDSTEKLIVEQQESAGKESNKVDEMEVSGESDLYKDTEDYVCPPASKKNIDPAEVDQQEGILGSADRAMPDAHTESEDPETPEGAGADVSGSSDLVSGTPPKPNSRRQSFVTLEKYVEGQAASPIQVTKFTGPLACTAKGKASDAQAATSSPGGGEPRRSETHRPPEGASTDIKSSKSEEWPAKRLSSGGTEEEEEDVIPDTQTTSGDESAPRNAQANKSLGGGQEEQGTDEETEDSEGTLNDSQTSQGTADDACRRSGRHRIRPRLPGQRPEDWEDYNQKKNKHSPEYDDSTDSSNTSQMDDLAPQNRSDKGEILSTPEDIHSKETQRKSARIDSIKLSGTYLQARSSRKKSLYSQSQDLLGSEEEGKPRRKSPRGDRQADANSQSQTRRSARKKAAQEAEKPARPKQRGRASAVDKQEALPIGSPARPCSQNETQSQETPDTKITVFSNSEEFEPEIRPGKLEAQVSLSTTAVPDAAASQAVAPEAPASQAVTPETPASQAVTPKDPASQAVTSETPASQAVTPETPASQAVTPKDPASQAVTSEAPASQAVTSETPASQAFTSETPASQAVTSETPASQAVTSETPASQAVTSETPASQAVTPEAPASQAVTPETPPSQAASPETPASQAASPETPASQAVTPETPPSQAASPETPASQAASPETPASQAASPETPASQAASPETPASQPSATVMPSPEATPLDPAPEEATPETPAAEEATPVTPAPEEATPVTSAPEEATPEMSAVEEATPVTPAPEEATPVTPAPEEATPVTPAPEEATPVTPAPEEATPEMFAVEEATPVTPAPEEATPVTPAPKEATSKDITPEKATLETPKAELATALQPEGLGGRNSAVVSESHGLSTDEGTEGGNATGSFSQEDSPSLTSSSNSLPQRRRRGRPSRSDKSHNSAESQLEANSQTSAVRPRTRRSMAAEEQLSQTSSSSLDGEHPKGKGRVSRRRSSQALLANKETSESDSSENRESPAPNKRRRNPKALVPSPLTVPNITTDVASGTSQRQPTQGTPTKSPYKTVSPLKPDSQKAAIISLTRVPLGLKKLEQQCEVVVCPIVALKPLPENPKKVAPNTDVKCIQSPIAPSQKDEQQMFSQAEVDPSDPCSLDNETPQRKSEPSYVGLHPGLSVPTAATNTRSNEDDYDDDVFTETTDSASSQATANLRLQVPDFSLEEKIQHVVGDDIEVQPQANASELCGVPAEGASASFTPSEQEEGGTLKALDEPTEEMGQISPLEDQAGFHVEVCPGHAPEEVEKEKEQNACPAMECGQDEDTEIGKDEVETHTLAPIDSLDSQPTAMVPSLPAAKDDDQASPAKNRTHEVLAGLESAQSPSGRTKGMWSPSASPSSSILKKAQKRALEEDAISPLVKSRRVSFANPIQHQELADDIDRRSPVIRTSSPKRIKTNSSIPQPKYVTTPTKGLLVLSPRNLHSAGHKSSKKCLMSEMSQEPRALSKDCIFPALVCCSAPIEAVLPLISTNMWPRGFGQLVRAKNIRTVGDLSALRVSDVKTLPIRSPKISNVKKALQLYEAQRKIRGCGDELKSFEEMEKMMCSSEPGETNTSLNQEEDDKTPHETLATALVDEPVSAYQPPETVRHKEEEEELAVEEKKKEEAQPSTEQAPRRQSVEGELLSQVDALISKASAEELGLCSAEQLVRMHHALGGVMQNVVLELQKRLSPAEGKP